MLLSITFTLNNEISRTRSAIAQKKAEIERLDKLIREVEGYEAKIKDLAEKIGVIQALKMRQRGPARVFHELAQICPDKLWIEKLSDKAGSMTIEGFAIDNQTSRPVHDPHGTESEIQGRPPHGDQAGRQGRRTDQILRAECADRQARNPRRPAAGSKSGG